MRYISTPTLLSITLGITLIFFLLDLYLFSGVKTLFRKTPGSFLYNHGALVYWTINGLLLLNFVTINLVFIFRLTAFYGFRNFGIALIMLFLIPKLVFGLVLFSEDIFRFLFFLFNKIVELFSPSGEGLADGSPAMPSRRAFITQIGLAAATVPLVSIGYGVTRGKYNFKVFRHTLYFPDLPDAFDGYKLAQISDIHSGSFDSRRDVQRGVDLLRREEADLIAFTGDLVNSRSVEIEAWLDIFAQPEAPDGVLSTLGNHDYGDYVHWDSEDDKIKNLQLLKEYHADMGYQLMLNESKIIERGGEKIAILGVENWGLPPFPQKGDLDLALQGSEEQDFRILLSHDPTHWDEKVLPHSKDVQLTLSGHTHGMQFGVEIAGWKWSPVQYRYNRWAGMYAEGGKYLNVNRGFGFIGFPGRVGIWPEVSIITLRKA